MLTLDRAALDAANQDAPEWLRLIRSRGFELFESMGMPSQDEEAWRYVELEFTLDDFEIPSAPGAALASQNPIGDALGATSGRAQIIDGFTVAADNTVGRNAVFSSLADAISSSPDVVEKAFGKGVNPDLDKFAAAHHAFQRDGVFLFIPDGTRIGQPFYVDVQATTPGVSLPRITVVVGSDAQASLVVHYRSPDEGRFLTVPQAEVVVGDASNFAMTTVQEWGRDTSAVAQQSLVAGRDSTLKFAEVGIGGALSRVHLTMKLAGRGGVGDVVGVYFGDRDQILDYRYFMNHAAPNTNSDMFLKGAVEDDASSVFTGLIRIEEEAQQTNAFQTNRNLVLSEGAQANSVPNLEILANDVRCGHGSTMGPLDEEQRYYLMSRGLDEVRADRLQVRGFFEEAITRLPEQSLAAPVREHVNAKYVAAQEEGRL